MSEAEDQVETDGDGKIGHDRDPEWRMQRVRHLVDLDLIGDVTRIRSILCKAAAAHGKKRERREGRLLNWDGELEKTVTSLIPFSLTSTSPCIRGRSGLYHQISKRGEIVTTGQIYSCVRAELLNEQGVAVHPSVAFSCNASRDHKRFCASSAFEMGAGGSCPLVPSFKGDRWVLNGRLRFQLVAVCTSSGRVWSNSSETDFNPFLFSGRGDQLSRPNDVSSRKRRSIVSFDDERDKHMMSSEDGTFDFDWSGKAVFSFYFSCVPTRFVYCIRPVGVENEVVPSEALNLTTFSCPMKFSRRRYNKPHMDVASCCFGSKMKESSSSRDVFDTHKFFTKLEHRFWRSQHVACVAREQLFEELSQEGSELLEPRALRHAHDHLRLVVSTDAKLSDTWESVGDKFLDLHPCCGHESVFSQFVPHLKKGDDAIFGKGCSDQVKTLPVVLRKHSCRISGFLTWKNRRVSSFHLLGGVLRFQFSVLEHRLIDVQDGLCTWSTRKMFFENFEWSSYGERPAHLYEVIDGFDVEYSDDHESMEVSLSPRSSDAATSKRFCTFTTSPHGDFTLLFRLCDLSGKSAYSFCIEPFDPEIRGTHPFLSYTSPKYALCRGGLPDQTGDPANDSD